MNDMTKQQPAKAGLMDPNAIKFVILLGAGSFLAVEMLRPKEDEAAKLEKKLIGKKKQLAKK